MDKVKKKGREDRADVLMFCQFILETLAKLIQDMFGIVDSAPLKAIAKVLDQDLLCSVPEPLLMEVFSNKLRKSKSGVFAL